jgi:lysophospholipase L1-like esterase
LAFRHSETLRRIGITAAAVLASLVAAEGALAVARYPTGELLPIANPPHRHFVWENFEFTHHYRFNSQGLRDRERALAKPEGEWRLAVLGDSFVEGFGVEMEQAFPARLEAMTGDAVLNFGLQNTGPVEYARMLRHLVLKHSPDAVLVCFFANDAANALMDAPALRRRDWIERRNPDWTWGAIFPRLRQLASAAVRCYQEYWADPVDEVERQAARKGIPRERIEAWRRSLPPELLRAGREHRLNMTFVAEPLLYPRSWAISLDLEGGAGMRGWRAAATALDHIDMLCSQWGVPLAVAYLPVAYQYDAAYVGGPNIHRNARWLTEGESRVQRALREWAAERNRPYLDLTPGFRRAASAAPGTLQYRVDFHWTPAGHDTAARLLEPWLKEHGLLRGSAAHAD